MWYWGGRIFFESSVTSLRHRSGPMEDKSLTQRSSDELPKADISVETTTPARPLVPLAVDTVDHRLYIPNHEDWNVHIKRDSDRLYCYSKTAGEDWFHLLLNGEIYVSRHHEKYCLACALRMGFLTEDRLFWQRRVPRKSNRVI